MRRTFIIKDRCSICGEYVEQIPDSVLKKEPHQHNTEYVFTHSGYKQYIHTKCWYDMISAQNKN